MSYPIAPSGGPPLVGAIIQSRGIVVLLCTSLRKGLCLYIRNRIRPGAGKRKAGPPWRGGYRQTRLNNEIVTRCNALINLVYAAYGRFFAESMCFDTTMEGNGGPWGGVPHCAKVSAAWLCGIGLGLCGMCTSENSYSTNSGE